jgi:hypothetical protein
MEDSNLLDRMTIFFGSLRYEVTAGEQIELLWKPREENSAIHRECFPDLQQAARRATSLGPAHDVFLQVAAEPSTTPWENESTQLLAYWHSRPRESGDPRNLEFAGVIEMRHLPYDEPSLAFFQDFPDGDTTCVAGQLYYRSRCPIRHRLAAEGRSPELEW